VVVTIIGLLAAYVGPKYFSQLGRSEQGVAKAQVEAFARALDTYRLEVGRYPSSEEGLEALLSKPANAARWNGPYLQKAVPDDPWGHAYLYRSPGALATSRSPRMARTASPEGPAMPPTSPINENLAERGCALRFVPYLPTT
jgi:general secretion pathway protein G